MKIFILINALMLFFFQITFSQSIPISTPHTINTPYGPQTFNTISFVYQPMYNGYGAADGPKSKKLMFTVYLQNGETFQGKARVNIEDSIHSIEIKEKKNSTIIKPEDTKNILAAHPDGLKMIGIPADSCWLFQIDEGAINTYSFLATPGTKYITAIQNEHDGDIVILNRKNLESIIKDDPKAMKYLEKDHLLKAVRIYNKNQS